MLCWCWVLRGSWYSNNISKTNMSKRHWAQQFSWSFATKSLFYVLNSAKLPLSLAWSLDSDLKGLAVQEYFAGWKHGNSCIATMTTKLDLGSLSSPWWYGKWMLGIDADWHLNSDALRTHEFHLTLLPIYWLFFNQSDGLQGCLMKWNSFFFPYAPVLPSYPSSSHLSRSDPGHLLPTWGCVLFCVCMLYLLFWSCDDSHLLDSAKQSLGNKSCTARVRELLKFPFMCSEPSF